jgi:hypothetical protein
LAKKLGLNTEVSNCGDVYLLRKNSEFTNGHIPNVNLNGYNYVSNLISKQQEIANNKDKFSSKVLNFAF